jgi:hypothetical protein
MVIFFNTQALAAFYLAPKARTTRTTWLGEQEGNACQNYH